MATRKTYKRERNLFDANSKTPFRLSRSRLENFMRCPRCFYLDRRLGIDQPSMPAFTLNSAVDALLKKEFDIYRTQQKTHPLMEQYNINAVPFMHPLLDEWRNNFKGMRFHHTPTNMIIFGAIDDVWIDSDKQLYIVDYKSTSTSETITLEGGYKEAYKRQMEMYQWLFKKAGFAVSDIGYFVYCNADKTKPVFDGRLEFGLEIISHTGNSEWVEAAVNDAHACLASDTIPDYSSECEHCQYRKATQQVECGGAKKTHMSHPRESQGELFSS